MPGSKQASSTANRSDSPSVRGSALLCGVVLEVACRLEGCAPSTLMAEIVGVTPQLARRQSGVPRRARRISQATTHAEAWLRGRLLKAGLTDVEAQQLLVERPSGVLEALLYWMFGGSALEPATRRAIRELEELDAQLFALAAARDVEAIVAWLRVEALHRPNLFAVVDAAGCPEAPGADLEPLAEVQVRLAHLGANMLLSLLAVIDHEVAPRIATEQWAGYSLLATLLAPDDARGVCSPIALMVDLVLAVGLASVNGELPAERPQPLAVERRLAGRRLPGRKRTTSTTARVINSLRRREKRLDRRALRSLMLDTKLKSAGPGQTVAQEANMLIPVLAAAHLFMGLMPTPGGKKAHPDRRGWRAAYLRWWRWHAEARGLPIAATGDLGPPAWLTFAQSSSRSRQSSGRSSNPRDCQ